MTDSPMTSQGTDARGAPPVDVEVLLAQVEAHALNHSNSLMDTAEQLRTALDRLRQAKEEAELRAERFYNLTAERTELANAERAEKAALQRRLAALTEAARAVLDHDCDECVTPWCPVRDDALPAALKSALDADAQEQGEA